MTTPSGIRVSSRSTASCNPPDGDTVGAWQVRRFNVRFDSMDTFIESKGSGTLRKSARLGMNVKSHALHERTLYEFGGAFDCQPERFVTWGEARSEPDCPAVTEVGWYADRYAATCLYPGDEMEVKYITVEQDGFRREGLGIVIRKTSAPWVPQGYMVFAIIAEYDATKHDFKDAVNPC